MRPLFYLLIIFSLDLNSFVVCYSQGSNADIINDGPYIYQTGGKLIVKWVNNNILEEDSIVPGNFPGIKKQFNLSCDYQDLIDSYVMKSIYSQSYRKVDSIGVISDIHGEYNTYIRLLKGVGVIDNNLNWKFGKGHLVVLGDVFDRGDKVTEVLWHLFGLQKQAEEAGGMVHLLLGNHELLVLGKDLRYINEKYRKVEIISNTKYYDLYSDNSVIGKWLRSMPVMISINDILFVHGGISMELVHRDLSIVQINKLFSNEIVGKEIVKNAENEEELFLEEDHGPLWYRGYFNDADFCESRLDSILDFYNKKHIVVGHTSSKEIRSLFHDKILGVDAGIMNQEPGEMLIYKNGTFYKGYVTGIRIKL
jgi:hypothetical protein